jgi:ectoine hydroxylase-related dioxygenase (phytanoyl-CoA dioxygenase family)
LSAKEKLDLIYERQCSDMGGEENLKKIKDANIARAICAYDKCFLDMAMLPIIQQVSRAMLGPYVTLMSQNGILNRPGTDHQQFTWHRDLNYQHWTSSRMLSLSALVCLDPFNELTGGTYVLPGSHRYEAFPSDDYVRANQKVITANPGDVIFFDSMLFHRTGANRSDMMRRGINHIIVPPFIKQQYNFPHMMASHGIRDHDTLQFLGFGMEIAEDDQSWRKEKLRLAQ